MTDDNKSLGSRFLGNLADRLQRTLFDAWKHRPETHEAEREKHLDHYGRAYGGPAHRGLDAADKATRENAPSWREPPLPGLEPSIGEDARSRGVRAYEAETRQIIAERTDFADELLSEARANLAKEPVRFEPENGRERGERTR